MSGPSKVIVLDPDPRAAAQIQLGFEREGLAALVPEIPAETAKIDLDGVIPALVLVGGDDGRSVELVRHVKKLLEAKGTDVPIVCSSRGAVRRELEAAGADEVIERPVFLRDIVTIGRLLSGVPSGQRDHLVGSLAETTGVLTLVRALSALGRSAVLTLIRGLRRGEVRFWDGEVTSAQVGLIHGQAALHQLLLWTDARFDFAHEDVVRRQQIPLSPEELFADAESFLEGVREHAGNLSPASVLEQDAIRVQTLGKQIPAEVHGILRMFDGHRVLADILEDSPYRVFETLRVTQKAVEVGLLKVVDAQRPKATWRAVLAIEEWLVGNETRDAVVERTASLDSTPVPSRQGQGQGQGQGKKKGKGKRRSKKMKAVVPAPDALKGDIDWGALVPRGIGAEVGPLSPVVPAQEAHGEVDTPTRDKPREGLEALMDTDKRQRIFPTEVGIEPSVVVSSGDTDEWRRVELEAKQKLETEEPKEEPAAQASRRNKRKDVHAQFAEKAKAIAPELVDPAAALVAVPQEVAPAKSDPFTAVTALSDASAEPRERRSGSTDASNLVRQLVAEAVTPTPGAGVNPAPSILGDSAATTIPTKRTIDNDVTTPFEKPTPEAAPDAAIHRLVAAPSTKAMIAEPITIAETPATTVSVTDVVKVTAAADTATITATPKLLIREKAVDHAAPVATDDEPSDGIVRSLIATADTARLTAAARMRPPDPEHDGPPIKETSGEIKQKTRDKSSSAVEEPSILVADLAAAHTAIAKAIEKPAPPPRADAASASRELEVSDTRRDAVSFSEAEEAFFKNADKSVPVVKVETFDDLDEGYEPVGFWDRLMGRKPKK